MSTPFTGRARYPLRTAAACMLALCGVAGAVDLRTPLAIPGAEAPASKAPSPSSLDAGPSWETVLASSHQHFPQVMAARERQRAIAARLLASEGALGLSLEGSSQQRLSGYYDGGYAESKLVQPIPEFAGKLYGGYRISQGDFPVYEDAFETLSGGEFKLGALLSLWRNREIDPRRAAIADGRVAMQQGALDALLTTLRVQREAGDAYLSWIAAAEQLRVFQGLLQLSLDRQHGLETRVREGDLPRVNLNENQQSILRRQSLLVEAERRVAAAANTLALYWRDARGEPQTPAVDRRPGPWPDLGAVDAKSLDATITAALAARPEAGVVEADIQREQLKLQLGENSLLPRVDLNVELGRDVGAGSVTREGTDTVVRVDVAIPLDTRTARGRISEAQANLDRLALDRRWTEDRIRVEIRNIANDLFAAARVLELATQEVDQAELLAQAEQDRFADGASDFFLMNLREESAADARTRAITARLRHAQSLANFHAATMRLDRFGLRAEDVATKR